MTKDCLNRHNGKVKSILLICFAVLIISLIRIATLSIYTYLPRLSVHQDGYYDYEGIMHWHTAYSHDAIGSYERLAKLGNRHHLDFLITTEHNNLLALKDHKEGWHGHMLTLVGIESTRKEGYLLGFNLYTSIKRSSSTDAFLSDTQQQGGFTVISHPDNPRWYWHPKIDQRIVGQEILDMTDQFNSASVIDLLTSVFYYPLNKPAAFMQLYHRPAEDLERWDAVTRQRHFIGTYGPDVHESIPILWDHNVPLPMTNDIIPIAHNHVILRMPFTGDFIRDKSMLYDAIEKGRLYIALDILQDATGFFFSARQGDKIAWMGDQLPAGLKTDFLITLPKHLVVKDPVINVYHNGQKIASSTAGKYAFQAMLPGSYRIEVECSIPTFWGLKRTVVWIYSNPIYLR